MHVAGMYTSYHTLQPFPQGIHQHGCQHIEELGKTKREALGHHGPISDPHPCPSLQRLNVQNNKGEHGFDNQDMDMKTIFRAVGPSFKEGLEVEPFESIHVYELMCQLLGIVPEPNDGHPGTLQPMLLSGESGRPLLWSLCM